MNRKTLALFLVVLSLVGRAVASQPGLVDFTIVDRIQFSVPGDWPVITSKSTSEKTVFAFQVPNPADEGTPDSSDLSIIATDLRTAQDKDAFQTQPRDNSHNAVERKLVEGWDCSSSSAVQNSTRTEYVIWDCRRVIHDCGVFVRVAWPHLPKNSPDYDDQMVKVLTNFLTSVAPFKGLPKSGVLRKPED